MTSEPPAGIGDTGLAHRLDDRCGQFQAVAGRNLQPARDGQQAAGLEPRQELGHRLDGVEITLAERLYAGAGHRQRIEQGNLDQVVAVFMARNEAPRLASDTA